MAGARGDAAALDGSGGAGGVGEDGGVAVDGASADGAMVGKTLLIELPAAPPVGVPFPILIRTGDGAPLDAVAEVAWPGTTGASVRLYRGRGSVAAAAAAAGAFTVTATAGERRGERSVTAAARPARTLAAGALSGADLIWDATSDVVLGGTVVVPAGQKLTIAAGTRVLAAPGANLDVAGELDARGTAAEPILLSRRDATPWGGIKVNANGKAALRHVLLTASGGDPTRRQGHTDTQPALWADRSELDVEGGGLTDLAGKAVAAVGAKVTLKDVMVARAAMGPELDSTEATLDGSWFVEFPDGDGVPAAEDNDADGMHLGVSGNLGRKKVVVKNGVVAMTDDDGIDHAGADVDVQEMFVIGARHEGIAASTGGTITVTDTVVARCGQGIEAGNGAPTVVVKHALLFDNGVGLRWGDEYPSANNGTLAASYVAVMGSTTASTRNLWTGGGNVSRPGALTVACSMVDSPDHDGMQGNVAGQIAWDANGCVEPGKRTLPGCPDGPIGPRCP